MHCDGNAADASLGRFRHYLCLLARARLGMRCSAKLDASDIVQQTLLDAHRKLDQFQGSEDELAAWLRQILANNLVDASRALGREKRDIRREVSIQDQLDESSARLEACLAAVQTGPVTRAEKNEQLLRMAWAMSQLPEAQRDAVELHHLQGLSLAEAAEQLGRTPTAVGGLLRRGLRKLRELLGEDYPEKEPLHEEG